MEHRILIDLIIFFQFTRFSSVFVAAKYEQETMAYHACTRVCTDLPSPMVCYYRFEIETYYTLSKACYNCPFNYTDCYRADCVSADGVKRMITVVNRSLPGPSIQVCLGDLVIVDVVNLLFQESTSIHWHGLHQRGTQYMDGVPFLTQCPILPNTMFQYKYEANIPGTHFWHSHVGCQRTDGAFGALIIRKPKSLESHSTMYDFDLPQHIVQIADWTSESSIAKMMAHFHGGGNNKPDSILINGKGAYRTFHDNKRNTTIHTPLTTYTVQKGKRYRFRIINAGFLNCPVQLSIDNHVMTIISSDGYNIQPAYVESLDSYAGERWDIIVKANQRIDNYWIKFRGLLDCGPKFKSVFGLAVLHYEGATRDYPRSIIDYDATYRSGLELNALNKGSGEFDYASVAEISDVNEYEYDPALKLNPDIALTFAFDFYALDNSLVHKENLYNFSQVPPKDRVYTPQINHISLKMPSFPLLSQPESITSSMFCTEEEMAKCDNTTYCHCTYTVDIPLNTIVELTLIDLGVTYEANHPFHLHGHSFRVVALEKLGNSTTVDEVASLDKSGKIFRNLQNPPIKDTVTIPDGGFTIIRFNASNPGYWLLHCHLDFHVEMGMAIIFHIGDRNNLPAIPEGFPKCGTFSPNKESHTDTRITPSARKEEGNIFQRIYFDIKNWHHNDSDKVHISNVAILLCFLVKLF